MYLWVAGSEKAGRDVIDLGVSDAAEAIAAEQPRARKIRTWTGCCSIKDCLSARTEDNDLPEGAVVTFYYAQRDAVSTARS